MVYARPQKTMMHVTATCATYEQSVLKVEHLVSDGFHALLGGLHLRLHVLLHAQPLRLLLPCQLQLLLHPPDQDVTADDSDESKGQYGAIEEPWHNALVSATECN